MARKFNLGKAPYLRVVDQKINSTSRMMLDVLIALIPIIIFGWIQNGIMPFIKNDISLWLLVKPLANVLVAAFASIAFEGLYFRLFKKVKGFKNVLKETWTSFAVLPGVFLALVLPVSAPLWMIVLGCFVANIIFKMLFGGFGHNIFNPALIAYAFLALAFAGSLNTGYSEFLDLTNVSGSTPLTNLSSVIANTSVIANKELVVGTYGSLWSFFFGTVPGSLGETSAFLCIVAFIYLSVRKTINWYVPTIYVGTVFVLTFFIGLACGYKGLWFPVFNVLSGGLLFGAVFMATEPVTTPRNPLGKVIYALGLGVLTVLFRLVGSMPEGVATSILFMCLFTPLLDRFTAKFRANKPNWKSILTLVIVFVVIAGIGIYGIFKVKNLDKFVEPDKPVIEEKYEISSTKQDNFELDKINVVVKKGKQSYNAVFKLAGNKVTYVSGLDTTDESTLSTLAKQVLGSIKKKGYIVSDNGSEIIASVDGMNGLITGKFTYKGNVITNFEITSHDESIDADHHYDCFEDVKNAIENLPGQLVGAGKDYGTIENVANATVSSTAIKNMYKVVYEYVNIIESDENNELIIVGKGFNGDIKGKITYDENLKITGFEIISHEESVDHISEVQQAINNLPGEFVSKGNKAQNVAGASYTSEGIRYIYEIAYNYLNKKTLVTQVAEGELKVVSKGNNGFITAKITYNAEKQITGYEVISHTEDVDYVSEVGTAINTIPGKLVEAGAEHAKVENVAGASYTTNALKKIYAAAFEYLTGGNE